MCGFAGNRRALACCRLNRRDVAGGAGSVDLLPGAPCGFVAPRAWTQVQHAGGEEQRVDADDQGNQQHDHGHGARRIDHQQRGNAERDGGHVVERPSHAAPQVGGAQKRRNPNEHRGVERHEHARTQEVHELPDGARRAGLHSEQRPEREQRHPGHGDAQIARSVQIEQHTSGETADGHEDARRDVGVLAGPGRVDVDKGVERVEQHGKQQH